MIDAAKRRLVDDPFASAICRALSPLLWDPQFEQEKHQDMEQRHSQARVLCFQCPCLRDCEQRLSEFERQGVGISGVVAARYSDVPAMARNNGHSQLECSICGERMRPQSDMHAEERRRPGSMKGVSRFHMGEGKCDTCWPKFHPEVKGDK